MSLGHLKLSKGISSPLSHLTVLFKRLFLIKEKCLGFLKLEETIKCLQNLVCLYSQGWEGLKSLSPAAPLKQLHGLWMTKGKRDPHSQHSTSSFLSTSALFVSEMNTLI